MRVREETVEIGKVDELRIGTRDNPVPRITGYFRSMAVGKSSILTVITTVIFQVGQVLKYITPRQLFNSLFPKKAVGTVICW